MRLNGSNNSWDGSKEATKLFMEDFHRDNPSHIFLLDVGATKVANTISYLNEWNKRNGIVRNVDSKIREVKRTWGDKGDKMMYDALANIGFMFELKSTKRDRWNQLRPYECLPTIGTVVTPSGKAIHYFISMLDILKLVPKIRRGQHDKSKETISKSLHHIPMERLYTLSGLLERIQSDYEENFELCCSVALYFNKEMGKLNNRINTLISKKVERHNAIWV